MRNRSVKEALFLLCDGVKTPSQARIPLAKAPSHGPKHTHLSHLMSHRATVMHCARKSASSKRRWTSLESRLSHAESLVRIRLVVITHGSVLYRS